MVCGQETIPFIVKQTVRTGFSTVRCLCISKPRSSLRGLDRLTHGLGRVPSLNSCFGQEINPIRLYSEKMSCMCFILRISVYKTYGEC